MADLCFMCNKLLSENNAVNIGRRSLKFIKAASLERKDGHIKYLNTLFSVSVHDECRKEYISKKSIEALKRSLQKSNEHSTSSSVPRKKIAAPKRCFGESDEPSTSASVPSMKKNEVFDFKRLCLFCGQPANKAAEVKKSPKYRRRISQISTLTFKDNVIKRAEERNDYLGELVKDRVSEHDLKAAEAKYHSDCLLNFNIPVPIKGPRNDQIKQSMKDIINYIENHEDSQFTVAELRDIPMDYVPSKKTIISKLQQKYGTDLIVTRKLGLVTTVSFRDVSSYLYSKSWYEDI